MGHLKDVAKRVAQSISENDWDKNPKLLVTVSAYKLCQEVIYHFLEAQLENLGLDPADYETSYDEDLANSCNTEQYILPVTITKVLADGEV